MEIKKSPKADLNLKKSYFFLLGIVLSLLMCIGIFSWSVTEKEIEMIETETVAVEVEQVEVTIQEDKRPPAPVKTQAVLISDALNVVKNDTKIEQDLSILDLDTDFEIAADAAKYGGNYTGPEEEVVEDTPVLFAEEEVTFDGKDYSEFSRWCQSNLRYPPIAADNGIQGRVQVQFVVERDGKVTNVKVVRGVDRELDEAAVAIVMKSPNKWTPAKNNGRAVRRLITMPIVFRLE